MVIFAIAATLFFFWFRAQAGLWWAYSRLRLFSIVFPCVAIGTCPVSYTHLDVYKRQVQ